MFFVQELCGVVVGAMVVVLCLGFVLEVTYGITIPVPGGIESLLYCGANLPSRLSGSSVRSAN